MCTNVEYDKLDLAEFVAGYLSTIKTYVPEATKFMLSHLELLMIKGTSYSWNSVRSFQPHIAKQVEVYRLEWSDTAEIPDRANTFLKHYDLCTAPTSRVTATPPSTTRSKQDGGQETRGCKQWNYTGSCTCEKDNDTYAAQHKCRVCTQDHPMLHCPKRRNPIPSTFWQPTSPSQLSSLNSTSDLSPVREFQDTLSHTVTSSLVSLNANTQSSNVSAVIRHILASRSDSPNAFGSKIPVYTALKINGWEDLLLGYHDKIVVEFLNYGWPINYCASQSPHFTMCNHPSALAFPDHVRHYIQTELSFGAIAGPFSTNPLNKPLVCSPLQTVPKCGSSKRRVVLDLGFPPTFPVSSGIPSNTYLDSPFKLQLPGIDRLCKLILAKRRGCCVYKKDLQRAYRQFPIDLVCYTAVFRVITQCSSPHVENWEACSLPSALRLTYCQISYTWLACSLDHKHKGKGM